MARGANSTTNFGSSSVRLKNVIIAHKAGDNFSRSFADKAARQLEERGCRVMMGPSGAKDNPFPVFLASCHEPIDLAVTFGGDGTALAAARQVSAAGIPILAINAGGHLGFLTEPLDFMESDDCIWDRLAHDRYAVEPRMMLQATVYEGDVLHREAVSDTFLALNEMCIKPAAADRMLTSILELEIDGEVVDQYQGDGLIVSTPTGSTCYNLSANGPIVHPGMEGITIAPICPLSLSSRPIVIPPAAHVGVWALGDYELNTKLWMDGVLATAIWPGHRVEVKKADCRAQFIILRENYSYYRTLRDKLLWAGARIKYNSHLQN
jgi:NAD+ kinase